jgi:hypothetical protein
MALNDEILSDVTEFVGEDSVTVTYGANTFTARKSYGAKNKVDLEIGGYMRDDDLNLVATATALGALNPQPRERVTVAGVVYEITERTGSTPFVFIRANRIP